MSVRITRRDFCSNPDDTRAADCGAPTVGLASARPLSSPGEVAMENGFVFVCAGMGVILSMFVHTHTHTHTHIILLSVLTMATLLI